MASDSSAHCPFKAQSRTEVAICKDMQMSVRLRAVRQRAISSVLFLVSQENPYTEQQMDAKMMSAIFQSIVHHKVTLLFCLDLSKNDLFLKKFTYCQNEGNSLAKFGIIIYLTQQTDIMPNTDPKSDHFPSQTSLLGCGFEQATCSTLPNQLWTIHPHGGTAMRDSIIYGNNLLLKLHKLLQADQTADSWAFLHIIITDGHDTDSACSFKRTSHMLSTLRSDLNIRDIKIIILGVEIEEVYAHSIRKLVGAAGIHGEYHDINLTDIHEMFHRIREDAGMHNRTPTLDNAESQHRTNHYAVLFTLDISGSMQGKKWDVTRHATVDFIRHLESKDVVSAVIFNETPHLVIQWAKRQNQARLKQQKAKHPFEEVMKNESNFDPEQLKCNKKITKQQTEISDPLINSVPLIQPRRKYMLDTSNEHRGNRKTGCFCCF